MKPSHANSPKHWLVFLSSLLAGGFWMPPIASGQIVPDSSLPTNSTITPNGNTLVIEGGTYSGENLFHSFSEFSLPTGTSAYFNNLLSIENILSRVTGESISNIDGILRANGGANLFLLNPNGIVFGPNAALNIGGSFFASTADSLRLSDGSDFSATNPEGSPLLTINVPLGLQLGPSPGKIINQSTALDSNSNNGNIVGLAVEPGETIGLVGGDISIEGGSLSAPVGTIKLISLSNGFWELGQEQNSSLEGIPIENSQFGNIELTRESNVSTSGAGGGSIDVVAGKLSVLDGSQLVAITEGDQPGGALKINTTSSVEVIGNSADGLEPSRISSQSQGAGSAGDLSIETTNLTVKDGIISAATFASGAGGNLTVRATSSVELVGGTVDGIFRGLVNAALGTGDAGDLTVETGRLTVRDGGFIFSGNRNEGNGGNLAVRATERVEVAGTSTDGTLPSTIQSAATPGPESVQLRFGLSFPSGNAGNLTIETGSLIVSDGAEISTKTDGSGNSGNLSVFASELVEVRGTSRDGQLASNLATDITGAGAGGDLNIETGRLLLAGGGFLSASTFGAGTGGNINIRASESVELMGTGFEAFELDFIGRFLSGELGLSERTTGIFTGTEGTGKSGNIAVETSSFRAQDGTLVFTPSFAEGTGGNINVRASERIELSGTVFGASNLDAGAAGDIEVSTARLLLRDGGVLGNTTLGSGAGGNVTAIATESIELRSRPINALVGTGIVANSINSPAPAGNITIDTKVLTIEDGAIVSTSSGFLSGTGTIRVGGTGGNLLVRASEKVEVSGVSPDGQFPSALRSATFTAADGGELSIETGSLIVWDGAEVSTIAEGMGRGGNLSVSAAELVEVRGSAAAPNGLFLSQLVSDSSDSGAGGNLTINAGRLQVLDRGLVSASSFGPGEGGDLTVVATGNVELVGIGFAEMQRVIIENFINRTLRLSDRVTGLFTGTEVAGAAGDITIEAKELIVSNGAIISAAAFDEGMGGRLSVRAERLELIGGGMSASTSGTGRAGDIQIDAGRLIVRDGALLGNATSTSGAAGNVVAIASESVEVGLTPEGALVPTGIVSNALDGTGNAGSVEIKTPQFIVRDRAQVNVSSTGTGSAGVLDIVADSILLDREGNLSAATASGTGGNIVLQAPNIQLRRGSIISTNASNSDGGNITIDTDTLAALENSDITANAEAGFGGRTSINAQGIFGTAFRELLTPNSDITATSQLGPQFSGIVEINTPEVDPGAGLIKLPVTLVDITGLVARDPCSQKEQSEFIMTGRGGLPPSPFDPLSSAVTAVEWATQEDTASAGISRSRNRSSSTTFSRDEESTEAQTIVEATGWRMNTNGDIILTASSPRAAPYRPGLTVPSCGEGP